MARAPRCVLSHAQAWEQARTAPNASQARSSGHAPLRQPEFLAIWGRGERCEKKWRARANTVAAIARTGARTTCDGSTRTSIPCLFACARSKARGTLEPWQSFFGCGRAPPRARRTRPTTALPRRPNRDHCSHPGVLSHTTPALRPLQYRRHTARFVFARVFFLPLRRSEACPNAQRRSLTAIAYSRLVAGAIRAAPPSRVARQPPNVVGHCLLSRPPAARHAAQRALAAPRAQQ